MAGLVPAIHVFTRCKFQQTWMPGSADKYTWSAQGRPPCPGMTLLARPKQSSSTRCCKCSIIFASACRANEGADHLGVLDAWRAFHARRNIHATGPRHANGFRDIVGVQASRDHERHLEIEIFEDVPVEYRAETAGAGSLRGRAGIEQDAVGNPCVSGQGGEIGWGQMGR